MSDKTVSPSRALRPAVSIVASFIGAHAIQPSELATLINEVHGALARLLARPAAAPAEAPKPAVPVKKSVQTDYLICLNDGKRFRSLKRHLKSRYDMTPDEYRAYWGLPSTYPMVAPGYARERSQLAKAMGLGQQRRRRQA